MDLAQFSWAEAKKSIEGKDREFKESWGKYLSWLRFFWRACKKTKKSQNKMKRGWTQTEPESFFEKEISIPIQLVSHRNLKELNEEREATSRNSNESRKRKTKESLKWERPFIQKVKRSLFICSNKREKSKGVKDEKVKWRSTRKLGKRIGRRVKKLNGMGISNKIKTINNG